MIRLKKSPGRHKKTCAGGKWKQRGASILIRGTSRQVVVVRSPDPQVFEEAIFILREDWRRKRNADQVIDEARRAAAQYLVRNGGGKKPPSEWVRGLLCAVAGALAAGAAWLTFHFVGV